jgi:hypothetical protein
MLLLDAGLARDKSPMTRVAKITAIIDYTTELNNMLILAA